MRIFIFAVLLVLGRGLCAQSGPMASEDLRFAAMIKRDTASLHRVLSPDLIYVHSNALTERKSDFIHSVRTGSIEYHQINREQAAVKKWGRTALINGIVQVSGKVRGAPFDIRLRYSAVYRKRAGAWRLVSWQSTRIP